MREKLTAYVRNLFREAADTPRNRDLEEEILQNTLDRYDDLIADGVSPESAYAQAVANIGNIGSLLEQPVHQPQTGPVQERRSGRRVIALVIAIVVVIALVVTAGMVLLFGLNFAGSSNRGFGRYEDPEDVFENRIDSMEESMEHWAEGVETELEDALQSAIDSGFAGFDYHYANEDSFTIGSAEVKAGNTNRLVIDWVAGSVTVETYDGDTISISEPEQEKEKNQLRWRQEGDTLTIRYCASTGSGQVGAKDLTVQIPAELADKLQYVQINTTSAETNVSGLKAGELQFDSTSGELDVSGAYRILDVDTTSGGMKFAGEVKNVEIDTVSGDVTMNCSETPDELSFDSTSGDLELLLPERRSFEASYDTVSGDFHNEFGGIQFRGDEMYFEGTEGGNPAELEFDTVSGDVRIEKAAG